MQYKHNPLGTSWSQALALIQFSLLRLGITNLFLKRYKDRTGGRRTSERELDWATNASDEEFFARAENDPKFRADIELVQERFAEKQTAK